MRSHPHYVPPAREYLVSVRETFAREVHFFSSLFDLLLYALFIGLILALVNMRHDIAVFERNESLRKRMFDNDFYKAVSTSTPVVVIFWSAAFSVNVS
jgi:hypothetical protein